MSPGESILAIPIDSRIISQLNSCFSALMSTELQDGTQHWGTLLSFNHLSWYGSPSSLAFIEFLILERHASQTHFCYQQSCCLKKPDNRQSPPFCMTMSPSKKLRGTKRTLLCLIFTIHFWLTSRHSTKSSRRLEFLVSHNSRTAQWKNSIPGSYCRATACTKWIATELMSV